jgi:type II secretory pathway pseudopilin PulG
MKDLYDILIKFFFAEFTLKKLRILLAVVVVGIVVLFVYERYTSSFQFNRLQKATDLLAKLQEIQIRSTNSTPEIDAARKQLVAQVVQAIDQKPISLDFVPSKLSIQMDAVLKFAAGAALWCLFALFYIPKLRSKEGKNSFIGLIMMSGLTGVIGIFVPPIWWPWFHLLLFPWLVIFAFITVLIPFAIIAARKTAKQNNCVNNLRQISAAKQQWALENSKPESAIPTFEDIAHYLSSERVAKCPCGGSYTIGTIGSEPMCSLAGHELKRN